MNKYDDSGDGRLDLNEFNTMVLDLQAEAARAREEAQPSRGYARSTAAVASAPAPAAYWYARPVARTSRPAPATR